ncbi:polysaccharide lyase [Polaribacter sp. BAL334]|uniref:polysaccharide lyase n=1 Tax=Polaribacter sp. BAL334 TaxID=1708178 RepID=UPI0018D2028F|nr:polysaccharide lyase [Polaribacter sp. BAL334]MBG7611218.1 polysaccharide lyase [Polaribacter sp. BAL334]
MKTKTNSKFHCNTLQISKLCMVLILVLSVSCEKKEQDNNIIVPPDEVGDCVAGAQLTMQESFETGDYTSNIKEIKTSGNPAEVIKTTDAREGEYILKSQISPERDNLYRTELSLKDAMYFKPEEEYWVGISTKLDTDFVLPSPFNDQGMIMQWHYDNWRRPEVPDAQPFVLRYDNGKINIQCEMIDGYLADVPATIGQWIDWVIHIKFDDKDGIIQIWWNGTQVLDWTGDNHQVEMIEGAYMKFGLYAAQFNPDKDFVISMPQGATRTVYHDNLRIAGADGCYDLVAPVRN